MGFSILSTSDTSLFDVPSDSHEGHDQRCLVFPPGRLRTLILFLKDGFFFLIHIYKTQMSEDLVFLLCVLA